MIKNAHIEHLQNWGEMVAKGDVGSFKIILDSDFCPYLEGYYCKEKRHFDCVDEDKKCDQFGYVGRVKYPCPYKCG